MLACAVLATFRWWLGLAVLGFAVVFFFYPKKDDEQRLLAEYAEEDTAPRPSPAP